MDDEMAEKKGCWLADEKVDYWDLTMVVQKDELLVDLRV
jgi:hypothetical protein